MENTINTAEAIAGIHDKPVRYASLLRKQAFPDRGIPYRLRRRYKEQARKEMNYRNLRTMLSAAIGAMQNAILAAQPIPNYSSGGIVRAGRELIYGTTNEMQFFPDEVAPIDKNILNNKYEKESN